MTETIQVKKISLSHAHAAVAKVDAADIKPKLFENALFLSQAEALTSVLLRIGSSQARRGKFGHLKVLSEENYNGRAIFSVRDPNEQHGYVVGLWVDYPKKAPASEDTLAKLAKLLRQMDPLLTTDGAKERARAVDVENQRSTNGVKPVLQELRVYKFAEEPIPGRDDRSREECVTAAYKQERWDFDLMFHYERQRKQVDGMYVRGVREEWRGFVETVESALALHNGRRPSVLEKPDLRGEAFDLDIKTAVDRSVCELAFGMAAKSATFSMPGAYASLSQLEKRVLHNDINNSFPNLEGIAEHCIEVGGHHLYRPEAYDRLKIPGFAVVSAKEDGNQTMLLVESERPTVAITMFYGDDGLIERCSFARVGQPPEEIRAATDDEKHYRRAALNPDDPDAPLARDIVFEKLSAAETEFPGFMASWKFSDGSLDTAEMSGVESRAAVELVAELAAGCSFDLDASPAPRP